MHLWAVSKWTCNLLLDTFSRHQKRLINYDTTRKLQDAIISKQDERKTVQSKHGKGYLRAECTFYIISLAGIRNVLPEEPEKTHSSFYSRTAGEFRLFFSVGFSKYFYSKHVCCCYRGNIVNDILGRNAEYIKIQSYILSFFSFLSYQDSRQLNLNLCGDIYNPSNKEIEAGKTVSVSRLAWIT